MPTLSKSATLGTLGLPAGDHVLRLHVEEHEISFEVTASSPPASDALPAGVSGRKPTGFLQKWGGTARRLEDASDAWLTHINEKHLR